MIYILFVIQLINGYIFVQSISLIKNDFKIDEIFSALIAVTVFVYLSTEIFTDYFWEIVLFDLIFIVTVITKSLPLHSWIDSRWKLYMMFTFNTIIIFDMFI